jgi:hypothetical protein
MPDSAELVDLGFSIADAEGVSFRFDGEHLILDFTDWREQPVSVRFENTIGFRYQLAEYTLSDGERFDSPHIVHESSWVRTHMDQNEAWSGTEWFHYKLNFNAGPTVEVLCKGVSVTRAPDHGV